MRTPAPAERIALAILVVRGQRVILDAELAALYGVSLKALKQAVRRNRSRFPDDFLFELSLTETRALRSQIVTLDVGSPGPSRGRHVKYASFAFTEQGVAMLSSVLRSARAIEVNIAIVRTFVRLRRLAMDHVELARRLAELEQVSTVHDERIRSIFAALRRLMASDDGSGPAGKPPVGFR